MADPAEDRPVIGGEEPLSKQDEDDIVAACMRLDRDSSDHLGTWMEEAAESYDFVAGHQISEDDMAILNEQARPAVVFNQLGPFFDTVAGAQINNRQETKYSPAHNDQAAGQKAEIAGLVADWARDRCDAEDEESEMFRDCLTCGFGWTETYMDYMDDPQGKIVIQRVDPFEMRYDPAAKQRNLSDAKSFARVKYMPVDEVYALWPDARDKVAASYKEDGDGATEPVEPVRDSYAADGDDVGADGRRKDGIAVYCFEWREVERGIIARNPSGQIETLTQEQWGKLQARLGKKNSPRSTKVPQKKWYRAYIAQGILLEGPIPAPCPYMSSFRCITGKWDRRGNTPYGIVRALKDPQRWANKWLSQTMHILNVGAKGGVMYEEGAIRDIRYWEQNYAKPGSNLPVAQGALSRGAIVPREPAVLPQGSFELMQFAISSLSNVSGLNNEIRGKVDVEQSGVVEWHRKQAAAALLAPIFDSLRRYYKEQGRLLLHFIATYIPPQRAIRVVGPDQQPAIVNSALIGDPAGYDIEVDEAPTSPNQKTAVWSFVGPQLPALVQMGIPMPVWLKLLKFSPLPESVVDEITLDMKNMPPQQDPHAAKAAAEIQLQQQKAAADMEHQKAKLQHDLIAEDRKAQAQMHIEAMHAEHKGRLEHQQATLKMQLAERQAELDMKIEMAKAHLQAQVASQKAQHDTHLKSEQAKVDGAIKVDQHQTNQKHTEAMAPSLQEHMEAGHEIHMATAKAQIDAIKTLTAAVKERDKKIEELMEAPTEVTHASGRKSTLRKVKSRSSMKGT